MITTLVLVAALFANSVATGPPGSQSYVGYNQHQQMEQQRYQPQQEQERWYSHGTESSYVAQSSAPTSDSNTLSEDVEPSPLPERWSEHFDPDSGQHYYYNAVDGTTSWDRPLPLENLDKEVVESENKGDSLPSVPKPETTGATNVVQNPEQEQRETPADHDVRGTSVMGEKGAMPELSSEVEMWQSNQNSRMKQPEPTQLSGIQRQQTNLVGQGQNNVLQANDWGSAQPSKQQSDGNTWGQSNSTESSVVRGEVQKVEYHGQPPQTQLQQQEQSSGWELPQQTENDDSSKQQVEPWGVSKSSERRHQYHTDPRKQLPPAVPSKETQAPSRDFSSNSPSSNGGWEAPKPVENSLPNDRTQNRDSYNQRQLWDEQRPLSGNQKSQPAQHQPPVQQVPPHASRLPPQQQPARPHYLQSQYPPQTYGSYNSNTPPGQTQYDPKYGGQNSYGRGYPPQQQPHSQLTASGQLTSLGAEADTSAVKDALSNTWKGLLGFGDRTREVVGTARDQVVTGATAAGQSLTARSSSIWETAKSTVGGVFENNDSGSQPGYSLGYNGQPPPDNRPPSSYQGRPTGVNQGFPSGPGTPGGRAPPPRNFGGPQPGRYGPPSGQQPRYGAPQQPNRSVELPSGQQPRYGTPQQPNRSVEPPGRQPGQHQNTHQQMKPPGYPNLQPRRDHPYPQMQKGQERGPMQAQYGNQSSSQQPSQIGYPAQRRSPLSGPPGPQPNSGPGTNQGTPQQEKQSDAWDHPGLMGDY